MDNTLTLGGRTLTQAEVRLVLGALLACTRSGGGSPIHALASEVAAVTGANPPLLQILQLQRTAHDEFAGEEALIDPVGP